MHLLQDKVATAVAGLLWVGSLISLALGGGNSPWHREMLAGALGATVVAAAGRKDVAIREVARVAYRAGVLQGPNSRGIAEHRSAIAEQETHRMAGK